MTTAITNTYFLFVHNTPRRGGYDTAQAFCGECNREIGEQGLTDEACAAYVAEILTAHNDTCGVYGINAVEYSKTVGLDDDERTGAVLCADDYCDNQ